MNPPPPSQQAVSLFITNVDKEGPFLKVWGQAEKNNSLYVEQFLLSAAPQFDQGIGKLPFESLQVGSLVCVKYKDEKYYRARIINIDLLSQVFVEVNFIDYGNQDIVPTGNIRSLQNFPSSFISIPPLATSFVFAEAHCPGGGEWKDQIFDLISKELRYREVNCHLITQATNYYLVKLYIDGTDLGSIFINRGLLQPIPLPAQQAVLLNMSLQKKAQPAPVVAPPPEINTFKVSTLEPLQTYAVYVSFVNDGPTHFSVQLQQSEQALAKLMKDINELSLRLLEDVPLPGTICFARCQEDGNVCRAVVTNEVDNQFKVFYVDFGNYEILPPECLYQIPFKFVLPKVMAIRVTLNGVEKSTVTMDMLLAFKKFVDNRLLYMKVLPSEKKTSIPKCELWDPETKTSALDVINRAAQHAYPEPLILNRGLTLPVKVSYVFSCNRFYVQLLAKEPELGKLMAELQGCCQSSDGVEDIKQGLPCCALFEADQLWYRSEIVNIIDRENVRVRYIDYGNEEVVTVKNLRMVEGELLTVLRPQAIECCLNGYQNIPADETRDALLEELILEQSFTMRVNEMIGKKALVELIDANNYNVASLLLDKIAASKSQVSPMLVQAGNTLEHRKSSDSSDNYRAQKTSPKEWNRNERSDNRNFDNEKDKWRNESRDARKNDDNRNDGSPDGDSSWRQNNKGFNRDDRNNRDWGDRGQREDRTGVNEKITRNRGDKGGENETNTWNSKDNDVQKSSSWTSPGAEPAGDNGWGDSATSPVQNNFQGSRQSRYDKFRIQKRYEERGDRPDRGDRGGWKNKEGDNEGRKGGWDKDGGNDDHRGGGWNKEGGKGRWNKESGNDGFREGGKGGFKKDGFKRDYKKDGGELSSSGSEKSFRKGPRTSSRNDFGGGRGYQNKGSSSFDTNSWNVSNVSAPIDAADSTAFFSRPDMVGSEAAVVISWFHNPTYFFCQLKSLQPEFKTLMVEIQQFYKDRMPEACVVGAPVVGLYPEDNVLYRAVILDAQAGQYTVFYVDYGNVAIITKVWPIDKKFMQTPIQALCCGLSGVGPAGEAWPDPLTLAQYFGKEYVARFLSSDGCRIFVELWDNQEEVSQQLIQANIVVPTVAEKAVEVPLLLNQQFRAVLKSVNNLHNIIVALDGIALSCKAHNIEMATESFEETLKAYLEQTLIIYVDDVLENSVLDVTFYDTEGNKILILTPDEGAEDTTDPLCPPLVISSRVSGYVSHVDETSVFIQPSYQVKEVAILLDKMYERYEHLRDDTDVIPEEGFVYSVRGSDGNWYRGRIESFDDDNVTVFYVDYGNTESVPFCSLRELKSDFHVPCMMCLEVNVLSGSAESFFNKDVVASIYYGEDGWESEFVECVQPEQVTEETICPEAQGEAIAEAVFEVGQPSTELQQPEGDQRVAPEEKPLGETSQPGVRVIVSHIDSPTQFYIQYSLAATQLESLQQQLQELAEELAVSENVSVGAVSLAPYSVDNLWYRAKVLDADEDITTVRFIDYGNTDVIDNSTTKVKTLPANLLSLAEYAARCSLTLKSVDEEWSETALEIFNQLANQDNVTAEIVVQDEKTTIVELYANGVNVKDVLIAQNLAIPCKIGAECSAATCYLSHLNSPSEFWVQMGNCVNELEFIATQLSGAENFPELDDLTPGTLCAAQFPDDGMWYRARILSNTVAGIELLFIDYGNPSFSANLRQLPEDLVVTPPLAQKCCLQKPEGIPYWTKQAQDKFAEISAEGATKLILNKITAGETATVELSLEETGENVLSLILPVTVDGYVKEFESLLRFSVEKDGELLPEPVCLEPMPGMEWDEESSKKFTELYPEGTLFQVELVAEDCVRLYKEGADIRPNLGGVRTTPLNISNTHSEKTDDIGISEDQIVDYEAGAQSDQLAKEQGPTHIRSEPDEAEGDNTIKSSEVDSGVVSKQETVKTGITDESLVEICEPVADNAENIAQSDDILINEQEWDILPETGKAESDDTGKSSKINLDAVSEQGVAEIETVDEGVLSTSKPGEHSKHIEELGKSDTTEQQFAAPTETDKAASGETIDDETTEQQFAAPTETDKAASGETIDDQTTEQQFAAAIETDKAASGETIDDETTEQQFAAAIETDKAACGETINDTSETDLDIASREVEIKKNEVTNQSEQSDEHDLTKEHATNKTDKLDAQDAVKSVSEATKNNNLPENKSVQPPLKEVQKETISHKETSTKVEKQKVASRPPSRDRISHDEKIIPACVSRAQSPLPVEGEDKPTSRPSSRISHDDKILPAVVSRPQSPMIETED